MKKITPRTQVGSTGGQSRAPTITSDPRGSLTVADSTFVDNDAFRFRTNDFTGLERYFGPRREAIVDRYEDASIAAANSGIRVQLQ